MSPCEGEGSRCKSSREHQFHSSVAERAMHFFRKEDHAGANRVGGSILLPYAIPGDDVASSIQACEACRVGASPTHLTNLFIHAHGQVDEPSVCKTDLTRCESGGRVQFYRSERKR